MESKIDTQPAVRHEENAGLEKHQLAHGIVDAAHLFQGMHIDPERSLSLLTYC